MKIRYLSVHFAAFVMILVVAAFVPLSLTPQDAKAAEEELQGVVREGDSKLRLKPGFKAQILSDSSVRITGGPGAAGGEFECSCGGSSEGCKVSVFPPAIECQTSKIGCESGCKMTVRPKFQVIE